MTVDAALWRTAVEERVCESAPERDLDPDDLLDSVSFVESLDETLHLDVDSDEFTEAVDAAIDRWLEVYASDGGAKPAASGPAGPPKGGQFALGGGRVGAKQKAKPAPRGKRGAPAAKQAPGPIAYNGQTGTGYGMKGGDARVKSLQNALNRLGITDAQGKPLVADGKYGPRTTAAVRKLQQKLGLKPDGVVTPELLERATKAKRTKESEDVFDEDPFDGRVLESLGEDSDGGRVFRVRIIRAGDSRNGRRYTESVLRAAAPLYEGARAYDHHRTPGELQTSTINGLVGSYRSVAYEDDGIYGNLHLLPSAMHTAEVLDATLEAQAAGLPALVGISHDVHAEEKNVISSRGRRMKEATVIRKVNSADVVADPAAGGIATRMVAGGIDTDTEESDVPVTTDAVLDAFKSASDEQLAAVGLARTSTTTTESTEPTGQRVTESGEPKTSFVAGLMIREKLNEAGLAQMRESITARLPERITESDVDREIAAYKGMIGDFERAGLRPTVTTQVVQESLDKKSKALDNFFAQNWTEGYHSFKQAWADITGYRQIDWSEDISRRIMRESFGAGFDSGVRSTESMDTTTWAQVLGDSITRRMQQAYNNPSLQSWRQIVSSITPVTDFRTQRVGRVGGYGELPTVAEGGPYQPLTSPPDEEATGALAKKGGTEDVTLEMIANDDRRAISKIPDKLGRAAAQTLYRAVWDTFANNATCTFDSTALFHTNHANTDTSAGLAQSTLSTGRRKMIEQAAYGDSTEILTLTPKFLVVPPELEEVAFMLSGSLAVPASNTVGASDQRNIHSGIQPILIPYFTDANDWFLVADPNDVPTLEVGFFNGRQEPELFSQADNNVGSVFNSDVFTWKIRFIFYVMILDYRGVYRGVG